jgi:hypothetical protein
VYSLLGGSVAKPDWGELPFERPVGHAAAPLEHGQRVIEKFFEGHGRPSTPLALPATDGKILKEARSHGKRTRSIPGARASGMGNYTSLGQSSYWILRDKGGKVLENVQGMLPSVTLAR